MNQNNNENQNIEQPQGTPEVADVAIPGRVRLWHTHPKALVGASVAVVLALAGGGAYAWTSHAATQAKESYSQAVEAEASAFGQLEAALTDYSPLLEGCAEKAQDPSLCGTLEKALANAGDLATVGADVSKVSDLDEATEQVKANTKKITTATATVKEAGEGVNTSIGEKALAGLLSAYEAAVEQGKQTATQGQALIDSTAGQVADDNTRQTLAATLSQLNETLNTQVDKTNTEDVKKATSTLTDLTSQVNTDMQAVQASSDAWQQAQSQAQASSSVASAPRQSGGQSASSKPTTGNGASSGKPSRTSSGATPHSGSTPARNGTSTGSKPTGTSGGKTSTGSTTPGGTVVGTDSDGGTWVAIPGTSTCRGVLGQDAICD